MSKFSGWVVKLLGVAVLLALTAGVPSAQDKMTPKHDTAALNASLRDVLKVGVDLFNNQGDYVGCFRLYQGALLSVKPFLAPELQKVVEKK